MTASNQGDSPSPGAPVRADNRKEKLRRELISYGLNALYLFVFLGLITAYRRVILEEYDIGYFHYGSNLIKALILAKVIMVGDLLGLGRRFENKPLIYPVLYKSLVFIAFVALFGVLEHVVGGLLQGKDVAAGIEELLHQGTYELLATCLLIFFAFLPFFAFRELERVLGKGAVTTLFFRGDHQGNNPAWRDS